MRHPTNERRAPTRYLAMLLLTAALFSACDKEDPVAVAVSELSVQLSTDRFAPTDPEIGTDQTVVVQVANSGSGEMTIRDVTIEGGDAASFELLGRDAANLGAGASTTFEVAFRPASPGTKRATLTISSDAVRSPVFTREISGTADRFVYDQVDRKGIPGLNTVFNHPSGTAGFDKTAYNVASPADDIATYRDQFITVLSAVGNADPEGTADLLLPDELPVSLGASTTSFAELTGRALGDDATDVALSVTVGAPELQSDTVDANDKAFRAAFPYLAAPHGS